MKNQVLRSTQVFKEILSETEESLLERRIPKIIRRSNKELTDCSHRALYLHSQKRFPTEDVEQFMDERRIETKREE